MASAAARMAEQAESPRERSVARRDKSGKKARTDERQATEAGLDLLRVLGWLVVHDVAVAGVSGMVVDHVAAGPSGVYVINRVDSTGRVEIDDTGVRCGGADQRHELNVVAEAAERIRTLIDGRPVAPLLCFARGEDLAGLVDGVAVCSTENILDVLTGQAARLDGATQAAIARALRQNLVPAAGSREAPEPVAVEAPAKARRGLFKKVVSEPVVESTPEPPAAAPVAEAAVVEAAVAEAPVVEAPVAEAAVVEAPDAMTTPRHLAPPVVEKPATEESPEPKRRAAAPPAAAVRPAPAEQAEPPAAVVVERPKAPLVAAVPVAAEVAAPEQTAPEDTAAEQTAAEQTAAEQTAAEQTAAEQAAAEQAAAEQAAAKKAAAEQAAAQQAAAEQAAAEDAAAEQAAREHVEAERAALAAELAEVEAARAKALAEARAASERRRQAVLEEQRAIAAERRAAAAERARIEAEHRETLAEQERIAAERKRVAEERRLAEEAQARALDERRRAVAERKAAEAAQALAEKQRLEAARLEAERAEHERHVLARVTADLAQRPETNRPETNRVAAALGLPARYAPPPHLLQPPTPTVSEKLKSKPRLGAGAMKVVATAVILVALVAGVAPRTPAAVRWVKLQLGMAAPSASFGGALSIRANAYHPDAKIVAGAPAPVKVRAGSVPRGSAAVAVPLQITNATVTKWMLPLGSDLVAVDSLGLEHHLTRAVTAVAGAGVLGSNLRISGGGTAHGDAVFVIPSGRIITEVRLEFSTAKNDRVVWTR